HLENIALSIRNVPGDFAARVADLPPERVIDPDVLDRVFRSVLDLLAMREPPVISGDADDVPDSRRCGEHRANAGRDRSHRGVALSAQTAVVRLAQLVVDVA